MSTTSRSSGDRIRTCDLWVMSPASYRAAPPRVGERKVTEASEQRPNRRPRRPRACAGCRADTACRPAAAHARERGGRATWCCCTWSSRRRAAAARCRSRRSCRCAGPHAPRRARTAPLAVLPPSVQTTAWRGPAGGSGAEWPECRRGGTAAAGAGVAGWPARAGGVPSEAGAGAGPSPSRRALHRTVWSSASRTVGP